MMTSVWRTSVVALCLIGLIAGCTSEDAQSLKDQAADAAAAIPADSFDMAALEELVAAGNAEIQATTRDLRRRLKRMEERLAALEEDVAAVADDAQGVADVEATTDDLTAQVQLLSQELERLTSHEATSGAESLLDPSACAADGGQWDPVLATCLR